MIAHTDVPTATTREYKSPRHLATALRWSLTGYVVVSAAAAAVGVDQYRLFRRAVAEPGSVRLARLDATDHRRLVVSALLILCELATTGLVIAWTRRLYRNLAPLGFHDLRFSAGWAVGAWFVPLLAFVRPKAIVNDIWRASDPAGEPGRGWHDRPVSALLHWWWGLWLFRSLIVDLGLLETGSAATLQAEGAYLVQASIVHATVAILTLSVVARTTSRQERLAVEAPGRRASAWRVPAVATICAAIAFVVVGYASWAVDPRLTDSGVRVTATTDGTGSARRTVYVDDLHVGDCFDDPAELAADPTATVSVTEVEVLPCDVGHDDEVFAVIHHPAAPDATYPGETAMLDDALTRCVDRFEPWVGTSYETSALDIITLGPNARGWSLGDRAIVCVVYRVDLEKLEASVRNAGI